MKRDESIKQEGKSTNPFTVPEKFKQATSPFLIDGYDSTMLEDRAYLKLDDEMLKLEYQINKLEDDLMIINDEILAAINIDDHSRTELLKAKKENIKKELERLNNKYFDLGAMSKFTTVLSYIFKKGSSKEKSFWHKIKYFFSKYVLSALSKRLRFTFNLKESLTKLSDINRNVDELISLRIPFGGLTGRYERLTNYINKANDIHAKISKNVNDFENKKTKQPDKKTGQLGSLLDIKQ